MADIGTDIDRAISALTEGKLVAIPTETVYGLAGNAFNPDAVASIFAAKNRPAFDPLIVHTGSLEQVKTLALKIPEKAGKLANSFWPGPLTLLLPKREIIPDIVTSGMPDAAFRIPDNPLTGKLLRALPFPLVAPSANPFGYISPTTAAHVNEQLGDKVAYILDGGPCEVGIESTIIGFPDEGPTVYRAGGLAREEIEKCIGPVQFIRHSTSNPKAPGMLKSHYAPRTPFRLGKLPEMIRQLEDRKTGILAFGKIPDGIIPEDTVVMNLSESGDLKEAAKNLFSYMRQLDNAKLDIILAEKVPDNGLGRAINDRLRRAAAE